MRESTEGSTREGSMKKQPFLSHHGHHPRRTCLTRVDDLLALTNSLVQLHNLVGGSQEIPNQSRRHHSPKGNRWCVDDELLALVLQMIVSPTLNSLSLIWIWWKEDLSGKQLGKARDQDSYGRNGMSWSQHMSRWFSLRTYELEWCVCSDGSLT